MRVLLCDDHSLFAEALGDALSARGDAVEVTSTPAVAVARAASWQPDVLVMDRSFPEGDVGLEAARDVLAVSPTTQVLMLTGSTDAALARCAVAAGVRGYLRKDAALDVVVTSVDQVAAGLLVVDAALLRPTAAPPSPPAWESLTAREREVLERLVHGESGQAMASAMDVSYSTMRTHVQNILLKLGVHSQLEAAAYAVERGLVRPRAG